MRRQVRFTMVGALLILCSTAAAGHAQWVFNGTVICDDVNLQRDADVIWDGLDGAIVTWWDWRNDGGDIYAQRIDFYGFVDWTPNGTPIAVTTGVQDAPRIMADGLGGAFIVWKDRQVDNGDLYAQKVDSSGAIQWPAAGVTVANESGTQSLHDLASDGSGGVIVVWRDTRGGDYAIYAQRVDAGGSPLWTPNGVAVCDTTSTRSDPTVASDGAGGAIITWEDFRSGTADVYAQRIDANGAARWEDDGNAICTATGNQNDPELIADGAGGAVIVWIDGRVAGPDIYVQAVDSLGNVQLLPDGLPVCQETGSQSAPMIVDVGAAFTIVTWQDYRGSDVDVYAQKINLDGEAQWTPDGVAICTAAGHQQYPCLAANGTGGAIITWEDNRGADADVYAQEIDSSGVVQWTTDGIAVGSETATQGDPRVVSIGSDVAIITWEDSRDGNYDIYAQSVLDGFWGYPFPAIQSILDLPDDQGGWVRIRMTASWYDNEEVPDYPVTGYNVWRRMDSPQSLVAPSSCDGWSWPADFEDVSPGLRIPYDLASMLGLPPGNWESLGFHAAAQQPEYYFLVPTRNDSTQSGVPWETYTVTAHTTTPSVYFVATPDSGYSVDNLAPAQPEGLEANQTIMPDGLQLSWAPNAEPDLSHYGVYRGTDADFVPAPANIICSTTETSCFDPDWHWYDNYYYKVSAVDRHDNESPHATVGPGDVTDTEDVRVPPKTFLAQNHPNPFSPRTAIRFGLSEPGEVRLNVYDVAGRLVRTLVSGKHEARHFEVYWDGRNGRGQPVATGVYFYRLEARSFAQTRKMLLVR